MYHYMEKGDADRLRVQRRDYPPSDADSWLDAIGKFPVKDEPKPNLKTTSAGNTYKDGVKTPNWRAAKRAGRLVTNPYNVGDWSIKCTDALFGITMQKIFVHTRHSIIWGQAIWKDQLYSKYQTFNAPDANKFAWSDYTEGLSLETRWGSYWNRAMAEANSSFFDAASNIAEAKETVRTLKDLIPQLASTLLELRRAGLKLVNPDAWAKAKRLMRDPNFRQAVAHGANPFKTGSIANHTANYWLLYRFAYLPMASAIEDLLKALETDYRWFLNTSKSGQRFEPEYVRHEKLVPSYLGPFKEVTTVKLSGLISTGVVDKYSSTSVGRSAKYSLYIPTAVWEIVPWSWLVDRFLHVGDWLQGWRLTPHEQRVGWVSLRETVEVEVRLEAPVLQRAAVAPAWEDGYFVPDIQGEKHVILAVTPIQPILVKARKNVFSRQCPELRPVLSWNDRELKLVQHLDHLAVLWQKVGGRFR